MTQQGYSDLLNSLLRSLVSQNGLSEGKWNELHRLLDNNGQGLPQHLINKSKLHSLLEGKNVLVMLLTSKTSSVTLRTKVRFGGMIAKLYKYILNQSVDGRLPLYFALTMPIQRLVEREQKEYLIIKLVEECPSSLKHEASSMSRHPLKLAFEAESSFHLIQFMISKDPSLLAKPSKPGDWLPIHDACSLKVDASIVAYMLSVYPSHHSICTKDGQNPLSLALKSSVKFKENYAVVVALNEFAHNLRISSNTISDDANKGSGSGTSPVSLDLKQNGSGKSALVIDLKQNDVSNESDQALLHKQDTPNKHYLLSKHNLELKQTKVLETMNKETTEKSTSKYLQTATNHINSEQQEVIDLSEVTKEDNSKDYKLKHVAFTLQEEVKKINDVILKTLQSNERCLSSIQTRSREMSRKGIDVQKEVKVALNNIASLQQQDFVTKFKGVSEFIMRIRKQEADSMKSLQNSLDQYQKKQTAVLSNAINNSNKDFQQKAIIILTRTSNLAIKKKSELVLQQKEVDQRKDTFKALKMETEKSLELEQNKHAKKLILMKEKSIKRGQPQVENVKKRLRIYNDVLHTSSVTKRIGALNASSLQSSRRTLTFSSQNMSASNLLDELRLFVTESENMFDKIKAIDRIRTHRTGGT